MSLFLTTVCGFITLFSFCVFIIKYVFLLIYLYRNSLVENWSNVAKGDFADKFEECQSNTNLCDDIGLDIICRELLLLV